MLERKYQKIFQKLWRRLHCEEMLIFELEGVLRKWITWNQADSCGQYLSEYEKYYQYFSKFYFVINLAWKSARFTYYPKYPCPAGKKFPALFELDNSFRTSASSETREAILRTWDFFSGFKVHFLEIIKITLLLLRKAYIGCFWSFP